MKRDAYDQRIEERSETQLDADQAIYRHCDAVYNVAQGMRSKAYSFSDLGLIDAANYLSRAALILEQAASEIPKCMALKLNTHIQGQQDDTGFILSCALNSILPETDNF